MKKITALLVALAVFATTAFAAPMSVAASLPEPVQTVASSADLDALFADINAVALTNEEAAAVEGEAIPPHIWATIINVAWSATKSAGVWGAVGGTLGALAGVFDVFYHGSSPWTILSYAGIGASAAFPVGYFIGAISYFGK